MYDFLHIHLLQFRLEELTDKDKFYIPQPAPATSAWSIVRFVKKNPNSKGILLEWESQYSQCLKKVKSLDFTQETLLESLKHDYRRIESCEGSTLCYPCGCEIKTSWSHTRGYESSNDHYCCHTCDPKTISSDRELVFPRRVGNYSCGFPNSGKFCEAHWEVNEELREATQEFFLNPGGEKKQIRLQAATHQLFKTKQETLPAFRNHY